MTNEEQRSSLLQMAKGAIQERVDYEVSRVVDNLLDMNTEAKASTTLFDGMYYELTYNGDKKELYLDAYKKWENKCILV